MENEPLKGMPETLKMLDEVSKPAKRLENHLVETGLNEILRICRTQIPEDKNGRNQKPE